MLLSKWLHGIGRQRIDLELLNARLTSDQYGSFEGQGFLRWKRRNGFRIELLTKGDGSLVEQLFSGRQRKVGGLVSPTEYLRLDAETRVGYAVESERLLVDAVDCCMGHECVAWRFANRHFLSAVDVRRGPRFARASSVQLLLSNGRRLPWPRASSTGKRCLQAMATVGNVTAYERPRGDVAVTVELAAPHDAGRIVDAVGCAFSFWAGRILPVIAYEARDGESDQLRILRSPFRPAGTSLAPPLGVVPTASLEPCQDVLLANAIDFFAADEGQDTRSLILASLSSRHSPFSIQVLVSCAVLEGLANGARLQQGIEVISAKQKEIVERCLDQHGLPSPLIKRFKGFMGKLNETSGSNVLGAMCNKGVLGFNSADWAAWKSRNKAAHGNLSLLGETFDERSDAVANHDRIHNMINKLVMAAIRYEGKYFDYATYREADFPPAPSGLAPT